MSKRLACVLFCLAWVGTAGAQYPDKPVRMIVPYPAAGAADFAARIMAERFADRWKQPVVVENRPGATGVIGVQALMASPPDGYTLMLHATAGLTIYPATAKKPVYDTLKDLTPISPVAYSVLVAVVPASQPASDMKGFLDFAKKNPGKLSYGSAGIGAMNHIGMELLKLRAGLDIAHVPYKGDSLVIADMLNGNVSVSLMSSNVAIPQIRAGKLKGLAVTSRTRADSVPELPTMIEAGVADFELKPWNGIIGPGGLPRDIVLKVNRDATEILGQPEVRKRLAELGFVADPAPPEAMAERIRTETEMWRGLVKRTNLVLD
jgi:tripartite-type tricarboxylate transporter receptor subunit TctC